jgi:anti-anti-sigma factor
LERFQTPSPFGPARKDAEGVQGGSGNAAVALNYFINRKNAICVLTLKGSVANDSEGAFSACVEEAVKTPTKYFVLNLSGVAGFDSSGLRHFALFQQKLRQSATLILCEIPGDISNQLKTNGVVRDSEIQADLMAALQFVLLCEKKGGKP